MADEPSEAPKASGPLPAPHPAQVAKKSGHRKGHKKTARVKVYVPGHRAVHGLRGHVGPAKG